MTVPKLRNELGLSKADKYIKLEVLKQMLIEKEGLDNDDDLITPLNTPAKLVHSVSSSSDT